MNQIDYKTAGVNIDAGNLIVKRITKVVKNTHNKNVINNIGGFASLFNLKEIISEYKNPILVQSIDGIGTKSIIARMMNKYDTIGIDLVSACCNDISVMAAKPLTILDYIANDRLKPEIIEEVIHGLAKSCKKHNIALVGGEIAEMPDIYQKNEVDLVGIITGIVDKDKIIDGTKIKNDNVVIGLPSSGLQTNGYSLARKLLFDIAKYKIDDDIQGLNKNIGETLLEPAYIYNQYIQLLLDNKITINGMAHISGGGMVDNIPRILPKGCSVKIFLNSWPILEIFKVLKDIGNINQNEMFRTFNMGIGLVIIVQKTEVEKIKSLLANKIDIYVIGKVITGNRKVILA